jgi:hypothetical protein
MSELEKCGFCGSEAKISCGFVACTNIYYCAAAGPSDDPRGTKWNDFMRRAAAVRTPEPPAPKRKIVQIAVDALGHLIGLDDFGALWTVEFYEPSFWKPLIGPDLPGDAP